MTADDLVWYIIITEMVAMVAGQGFQDVREAVSSGSYGATLHQPVPFLDLKMCEWAGRIAFELPVYGALGLTLGVMFTGEQLFAVSDVPVVFASMFLSCLIMCFLFIVVGLIETWGSYSRPAFWILQKFKFLLGGLILPLSLYPKVATDIAWMTPFPAVLFVPGRIPLGVTEEELLTGFLAQVFWIGVVAVCAAMMQMRVNKVIMTRGY